MQLYGDIGVELGVSQLNVSLGLMSDSAGFTEPDAMSEFYGYSSYTAPSVITLNASSITTTSITANGYATASVGAPAITQRGFYFGTNPNMLSNPRYTNADWFGGPNFYMTRSGLNPSTTYYMWAFVVDSVQETVGSVVSQATNTPFSPQFYSFNEGSSGLERYRIGGYIDVSLQYRDPDTGSFVQYGSYYTADAGFRALSGMTKSGNTGVHCINAENLRYDKVTATSNTTRTNTGMRQCGHVASYPARYMTNRIWSITQSGFNRTYSVFVINNTPELCTWDAYLTGSTTWTAGATLNVYYYFNYTTYAN